MTIAEQIVDKAYDRARDQMKFVHSPDLQLLVLLQALEWPDVEAGVIAACRKRVGL